jgi:DNA-directed RNA polymerase subunit RPC12/RpoP
MEDIEFFCVICGQSLCASLELAGTVGECPMCLSMVPIPGYGSQAGKIGGGDDAASQRILSIEIVYRCDACGKPLQVDARWQGTAHDCPACSAETRVPRWTGSPQALSKPTGPPAAYPAHLTAAEVEFLTSMNGAGGKRSAAPIRV